MTLQSMFFQHIFFRTKMIIQVTAIALSFLTSTMGSRIYFYFDHTFYSVDGAVINLLFCYST